MCLATSELEAIYAWFFFLGIPSLVLASGIECLLASAARRFFAPGQPMRACWWWLAVGAACRFVGYLVAHFLVPYLSLNLAKPVQQWGFVLGGPLALLCMAFGLSRVAVLLRRHNWALALAGHDWWVVGAMILMLVRHVYEIGQDVAWHGLRSFPQMVLWLTEPLLLLVVIQSLAVRRSTVRMGSGLVVSCWSALAVAALLTGVGDVQAWAHRTFQLPETVRAFTDPVWVAAGMVGALAPAFQIEASSLALTWKPPRPAVTP